MKAYFTSVCQ